MKNRKAFQFYRSYYDLVKELTTEKDKLDFIMAILDKQFLDIEPQLTGLAKFAYISQKHSIDAQVKGFQNKVGYVPPTEPPIYVAGNTIMTTEPPTEPPLVQEKEKEKEKEKLNLINALELDMFSNEAQIAADEFLKNWKQ